ncbi:MAG: hypothetical protein AAB552_01800 [Patescibacteria group bacterium]
MYGRQLLKRIAIILGLVIVGGYSIITLAGFIQGPRITITTPQTGFSTTTALVTIIGHAVHVNSFTINDAPTALDLEGNFSGQLLLAEGYNIISVEAKDRYGRTTEKKIEIILHPEQPLNNF